MTHKRSEKETRYLREIVGADGAKVHYFNPASPEDARAYRERRRANQLAEMRQATGTKPRRQRSAQERAAAQVREMRRAAGGAGK